MMVKNVEENCKDDEENAEYFSDLISTLFRNVPSIRINKKAFRSSVSFTLCCTRLYFDDDTGMPMFNIPNNISEVLLNTRPTLFNFFEWNIEKMTTNEIIFNLSSPLFKNIPARLQEYGDVGIARFQVLRHRLLVFLIVVIETVVTKKQPGHAPMLKVACYMERIMRFHIFFKYNLCNGNRCKKMSCVLTDSYSEKICNSCLLIRPPSSKRACWSCGNN